MAEKFRKEIRWVYNQRMPWLQIMTEAGLQKVGRLGTKRQGLWPSGLANNLPSKLARRGQVHNLRANNNWAESILREWMCYIYLWVCAADGRRGTSWSSARTPWILPSRNGAASSPSEATRSSWATSSLQHEHFHFLFFWLWVDPRSEIDLVSSKPELYFPQVLSFDGWHFNFICKFVHKLVINQFYPNPIPTTQNQNIWPETTVKELFSYFLFPSEPVILHYWWGA